METPYRADNLTQTPLEHYLDRLLHSNASEISYRLDLPWEKNGFVLRVLGKNMHCNYPAVDDPHWTDRWRILFGRYLLEGKKPGPPGRFVTYAQMPWGNVYNEKFRQRCLDRLAGTYGYKVDVYKAVCQAMGAVPVAGSGVGYEFEFLPDLFVRFILWEGDDEFPPSSQILFSENFPDAFAAEDRVVVCEYILSEMKKAEQAL